jgi:hypothetical protein
VGEGTRGLQALSAGTSRALEEVVVVALATTLKHLPIRQRITAGTLSASLFIRPQQPATCNLGPGLGTRAAARWMQWTDVRNGPTVFPSAEY